MKGLAMDDGSRRAVVALAMVVASAWCGFPASGQGALAVRGTKSFDGLERGQRGWGLSVFAGAEPERFEAEVLGVLENLNPDTSFLLVRLTGQDLERSGVIAGMSGSPVYFDDRLVGAVSFGWPFSHDAIAGITPIDAMRRLGEDERQGAVSAGAWVPPEAGSGTVPEAGFWTASKTSSWTLPKIGELVASGGGEEALERLLSTLAPRRRGEASPALIWAGGGLGEATRALLSSAVGPVAASGALLASDAPPRIEAGGAVAMMLVDGDLRLAAAGTVTERDGERVVAFGHPVLGSGKIAVPMAEAEIITVVASRLSSFKVPSLGRVVGAFEIDRLVGVAGTIGGEAPMIPVTVTVTSPEREKSFGMRVAAIEEMTPGLVATAVLGAIDATSQATGPTGIDMTAHFELRGQSPVILRQSYDGGGAVREAVGYLGSVAAYLTGNDLEKVEIEAIDVEIVQAVAPRAETLVAVHADRSVVRPGETVRLSLELTAWRGETRTQTLEVELPRDLPAGAYSLLVGDGPSIDAAKLEMAPRNPRRLVDAIDFLSSFRSRLDLVIVGVHRAPGLSADGRSLPQLPGSVRSLWAASGKVGTTVLPLAVAQEQVLRLERPIDGGHRVDFEVRRPKAAGGGGQ